MPSHNVILSSFKTKLSSKSNDKGYTLRKFTTSYAFMRIIEAFKNNFFRSTFGHRVCISYKLWLRMRYLKLCYGKDITLAKSVAMNPATTKMESFAKIVDGF